MKHYEILGGSLDMTDEQSVKDYFSSLDDQSIDGLIITASKVTSGKFSNAQTDDIRAMFDSKFIGPFVVLREALPKIKKGSSIVLFSGVLSRRPGQSTAGLAAVNAAIEGLGRALALELAPDIRVNVISPGITQTEAYEGLSSSQLDEMFKTIANSLPLKRVADASDIAEAVLYLLNNPFTTGHVLDVDGGHLIG